MPEQRSVWWCAIDTNQGHATYDELKARHVVAQGWSDLGDLSTLVGQPQDRIKEAVAEKAKATRFEEMKDSAIRVFVNLLSATRAGDVVGIKAGALVVGMEGTSVKGICEILPQTAVPL
jgi:hypothetical protein